MYSTMQTGGTKTDYTLESTANAEVVLRSLIGTEALAGAVATRFVIQRVDNTTGATPVQVSNIKFNSRSATPPAATVLTQWTTNPTLLGNPLLVFSYFSNAQDAQRRWIADPRKPIILDNGEWLSYSAASQTDTAIALMFETSMLVPSVARGRRGTRNGLWHNSDRQLHRLQNTTADASGFTENAYVGVQRTDWQDTNSISLGAMWIPNSYDVAAAYNIGTGLTCDATLALVGSATYSVTMGLTTADSASLVAAATYNITTGYSTANIGTLIDAANFAILTGLSFSVSASLVAAAAFNISTGISISSTGPWYVSASFNVGTGFSAANIATLGNAITLALTTGLSMAGGLAYQTSVSYAVTMGLSASGALTISLALTLGVTTGLTTANVAGLVASGSYNVTTGLTVADIATLIASATLSATMGLATAGAKSMQVAMALNVTNGLSTTNVLGMAVAIPLALVAGFNTSNIGTFNHGMALGFTAGLGMAGSAALVAQASFAVHTVITTAQAAFNTIFVTMGLGVTLGFLPNHANCLKFKDIEAAPTVRAALISSGATYTVGVISAPTVIAKGDVVGN